ncbi:MAG: hypothetical protein E6Q83_00665 [Thiothrix sp.]|nr:MAG: hypothetical protein E6Q83_00665 [Thiothrix sp.]
MRTVFFLLISLFLSTSASAHTSVLPHPATTNEGFHALMHTGISVVLVGVLYLLVSKLLASKRINVKRKP